MKRVIFVRHGKAEEHAESDIDFDRALHTKGERDAKIIAETLHQRNILPDLFVSSDAPRAFQTAEIFAKQVNYEPSRIEKQHFIYDSYTTGQLIDYLTKLDEQLKTVIIFGHNPYISQSAIRLSKNFYRSFPTAGCLSLKFQVENWQLDPDSGEIEFFEFPKKYR